MSAGPSADPRAAPDPFAAAGELREAYLAVDWAASPVGPPAQWPPALRTALALVFATSFPATLLWGPRSVLLYNTGYTELVAGKHPSALGRPCVEVFPEIWDQIGPLLEGVLAGRGSVRMVDQELRLVRRGFAEECYFTYAYSPVDGPDGRVEGVLDLVVETTRAVVDARRAHLLSRLADLPLLLTDPTELAGLALPLLRTDPEDLPLVELLVPGEAGRPLEPDLSAAPAEAGAQPVVVTGPAGRTAWLPLGGLGAGGRRPLLAVALSPALAEDEHYLGFLRQVAAALGNAVAVASAARDVRARVDLQAEQVRRLVGLVEALRALLEADGPEELERVVSHHAARLIGARWARLVLTDDADDADDTEGPAALPAGPGATGPGPGDGSTGAVRLEVVGRHLGTLHLARHGDRSAHDLTAEDRALLTLLASSASQALDRSRARAAERVATEAVRAIAEELQRSLLTDPPAVPGLEVAVRYVPAAEHAQVGGDWYDVFTTAAGAVQVVIGDVTGHDQRAAAAMGQLRNLLRGVAHSGGGSPAQVLAELDSAWDHLGITSLATTVLGSLSRPGPDGGRDLVWSSAGHLPPLLMGHGGPPELLEAPAELLLGLQAGAARSDHTTPLPPGAVVLLYTDGLVERRGVDLQDGLTWLCEAAAGLVGRSPDELCDALLELVGGRVDDDIALIALRVGA